MPSAFSSLREVRTTECEGQPLMEAEELEAATSRPSRIRFAVLGVLCVAGLVACVPLLKPQAAVVRSQAASTMNAQVVHLQHKQVQEPDKQTVASQGNCSGAGAGCLETKCCMDPGHQCFTKNKWWAQCMPECTPGPNPLDQVSPSPWECEALGEKVPGLPHECAADFSENCAEKKCCQGVGMQCFQKNEGWAACKPSCTPGPDLMESNSDPWTCEGLGPKKLGAAPWVKTKCSATGDDCSKTSCCQDAGLQCYEQNEFWAQCKETCKPGEKPNSWDQAWNCKEKGVRNPGYSDVVEGGVKGVIGDWVPEKCTGTYDNCADSQCCYGVDYQCYTKNQ